MDLNKDNGWKHSGLLHNSQNISLDRMNFLNVPKYQIICLETLTVKKSF